MEQSVALTKRQHFVPVFYLRQWADPQSNQIVCHDLSKATSFENIADNTLLKQYLYEEDVQAPDNRVENILSAMEGTVSQTVAKLATLVDIAIGIADRRQAGRTFSRNLTNQDVGAIKLFAAYQYLRVPGAIEQKTTELQPSEIPAEEKQFQLNPGRFVTAGFSYIRGRFDGLKLLIFISEGEDFVTSDWPCFDFKDDFNAPLLGEEIGVNPDVIAYLPLSPKLGAVFYPASHAPQSGSHQTPSVVAKFLPNSMVRNQNTLVIQQAERFVVARRKESFIFKVAAKRKKSQTKFGGVPG